MSQGGPVRLAKSYVALLILTLASMALLVAIFVRARNDAKEHVFTHQRRLAELAKSGIEEFFRLEIGLLEFLAAHENVIEINKDGQFLLRLLYKNQKENITNITRVDVNRQIVYNYPEKSVVGAYLGDQEHIKTVFRTKKTTVSSVFRAIEGFDAVAVHVPVFRNGEFFGTLAFLIPFEDIGRRHVGSIQLGEHGSAVLYDEKGAVIYSKNRKSVGKKVNDWELRELLALKATIDAGRGHGVAAVRPNRGMIEGLGDETPIITYCLPIQIENIVWFIKIAMPEKDAVGYVSGFSSKWTIMIVSAILLFTLWGTLLTRSIVSAKREQERRIANERILQAESEARIARAMLVNAVDQSPAGVIIADAASGKVLLINLAARSSGCLAPAYGTEDMDILSSDAWTCVKPDGVRFGADELPLNRSLTSGETVFNEEVVVEAGEQGKEWYSITSAPVLSPQGEVVAAIAILQNISERKRHEERLRDLNETLEQIVRERTFKMQESINELEAFSYSVSHDLRAPLRSLAGFSKILLRDYADCLDEEGRAYLEGIARNSEKMGNLIDSLLQLSRISQKKLTISRVNVSALCRSIVEETLLANGYQGPKADIIFQPEIVVFADADMIGIVLRNLLENALKFTSKVNSPRIEVGAVLADGCIKVFVKDNGAGFNMEYAEKLFAPFQRLHSTEEYPGTGIGLATVQRIVSRHGGKVWAEGKEGEGATFWFSLPC